MNEKGNKRREWVKTAAIIFLSVMLVLTFFSNTIMNYSLPEVATQYVMSDSITAKIRGTGVVESGDPYYVEITESRKVASVAVRVGDEVQKGDVILYLEDSESEELKIAQQTLENAREALKDARDRYNDAILNPNISAADIQAANGNVSANTYRQQINDAQAALTAAQDALKPYSNKVAEISQKIKDFDTQLTWDRPRLDAAKSKLDAAKSAYQSVSGNDAESKEKKAALDKAQKEYDTINQTVSNLLSQKSALEVELYAAQKNEAAAAKAVSDADENLKALTNMLDNKKLLEDKLDDIANAQKAVEKAQAEVDKLTEKAIDATVTADISGTITAVNVTAGKTATAGSAVAVIQPEGQGFTMSFSVTNEQARRLAVGDRAELVNSWWYYDVEVVLASIKPDPNNPGQNKLLTFNVSGSVVAGQTFSVSVGQQSANYDLVVPNSAIREDNNGKFILIVESRSTPLGNRYSAARVDVEVLASDDTKSAISGALYGYEYVITTSTQPVDAGQLVRLTD
ncbi:MAG: biotin/lipoyl-binding protein [Acetatifactor sp.]|nr:biotin/lipoyl-binding protein [Acetatifactor sp.]